MNKQESLKEQLLNSFARLRKVVNTNLGELDFIKEFYINLRAYGKIGEVLLQ